MGLAVHTDGPWMNCTVPGEQEGSPGEKRWPLIPVHCHGPRSFTFCLQLPTEGSPNQGPAPANRERGFPQVPGEFFSSAGQVTVVSQPGALRSQWHHLSQGPSAVPGATAQPHTCARVQKDQGVKKTVSLFPVSILLQPTDA